jgi:hypothetical protein
VSEAGRRARLDMRVREADKDRWRQASAKVGLRLSKWCEQTLNEAVKGRGQALQRHIARSTALQRQRRFRKES